MKNEDRIVEILAETLQQLDKHGEILGNQSKLIENQGHLLEKLVSGQDVLTQELIGLRKDFHKMNDHLLTRQEKMEDRVIRLEDKVFK